MKYLFCALIAVSFWMLSLPANAYQAKRCVHHKIKKVKKICRCKMRKKPAYICNRSCRPNVCMGNKGIRTKSPYSYPSAFFQNSGYGLWVPNCNPYTCYGCRRCRCR